MYIILVAMEKEAQYIDCPNAKVIVTGIGLNNVVKTLSRALIHGKISENDKIINVGYAGSNCFNIGDIVAVDGVVRIRPSETVEEDEYRLSVNYINSLKPLYIAPCYTADDFVEDISKTIPLVDMELYYIRAFFKNLISFKIVSDNLSEKAYDKFNPEEAWVKMNRILNEITS